MVRLAQQKLVIQNNNSSRSKAPALNNRLIVRTLQRSRQVSFVLVATALFGGFDECAQGSSTLGRHITVTSQIQMFGENKAYFLHCIRSIPVSYLVQKPIYIHN
jgi:hypothetical protein